jgi:hypothetical protein
MKSRRALNLASLVLFIAYLAFCDIPDESHASALDEERSYFSETGVEYGNYIL